MPLTFIKHSFILLLRAYINFDNYEACFYFIFGSIHISLTIMKHVCISLLRAYIIVGIYTAFSFFGSLNYHWKRKNACLNFSVCEHNYLWYLWSMLLFYFWKHSLPSTLIRHAFIFFFLLGADINFGHYESCF